MPDASPVAAPRGPLHFASFQRFWCARVLSSISFQMLAVAIGWHIYSLTHSAFALGLVGLAQFVPMFALTLVVGHVADRYDRRRIAAICQAGEAVVAALFLLGTLQDWLTPSMIYALAALVGALRAFESPSMASMLPAVIPRSVLPQATAVATAATQAAAILGPACGGLLYGVGASAVYAVSVFAFFGASLLSGAIVYASPPPRRPPATLASVFEGIRFIRSQPVILGALSLDLFAVLFGGATALLPIFARDVLDAGPWALGLLRSAPAVGALLGTFWLARFPLKNRPGRSMFLGVIAFGLATMVFGLSHDFWVSLVALAIMGAADVVGVVVRMSLVQLRTPEDMLGRVSAVNALFIGTSNQLGEFESGLTAGWWGAQAAVLAGGAATVAVALLWMRWFPALLHTRSLAGEPQKSSASTS